MKWEEIWAPVAVVIGGVFVIVVLVKVVVALWKTPLPLATLGIAISSFLINCLTVVVLVAVFATFILAIATLSEKVTEQAVSTLSEIRNLKSSHAEEVMAVFLATTSEISVFTLSKDFGWETKSLMALYLLVVMAILHMMISANKAVKIVGRSLLGGISVLTALWIVYRYDLYLTLERKKAFDHCMEWLKSLKHGDLASLSLMLSLIGAFLIMTIVRACSKEAVEA